MQEELSKMKSLLYELINDNSNKICDLEDRLDRSISSSPDYTR